MTNQESIAETGVDSGEGHRPTLGVVAISYNEEQDLPRFIEHLLPWVDEIIIVDDGSTDRTAEIAAAGGEKVKFIVAPREKDEFYSHQRNKGIAAANSEWLLHMDIDERLPTELAKEVCLAIQDPNKDGFRYRRLNYFLHRPMRGGSWQDWNQIHLARRSKFHFEGMFHETCCLDAAEGRVGQLTTRMHHLNDCSFFDRLRKSNQYLEEVVEGLKSRGCRAGYFSLLWAPSKEFVKKYFFKLGFRDGVPGLISAIHSATAIFRAYAVLWEQQNQIDRAHLEAQFANDE